MEEDSLQNGHNEAVIQIQTQVRKFHEQKKHFRVYHGSTSSTRALRFDRDAIVDTSGLTKLFPVDRLTKTVQVESNVPMDALATHTLKSGLIPKVVMEFKGITAGGGYSGVSGESSSFKYGPFQHIVSEIEIVLGDGSCVIANRSMRPDLLEGAGGTMGTLGIVTLLTIELVDAKSYVDLEICPYADLAMVPRAMEEASETDIDFVDGVFFQKGLSVLMLGQMTDKPQAKVLVRKQVHWFADEVLSIIKKDKQRTMISMKLEDYLFRYDHGAFWGGKVAFQHYHVPNNRITRRLADPFLDSRTCYVALHKTGLANEYLVQDFAIPASTVVEFMSHVTTTLPHFQLFICPGLSTKEMKIADRGTERFRAIAGERMFGVGVYGRGPSEPKAFAKLNHELEQKAFALYGAKLLYSRVYSTEEEFWATYDRVHYSELRRKYCAEGLPDVYQKLAADMAVLGKRRPVMGILETLEYKARGKKDYLLTEKR